MSMEHRKIPIIKLGQNLLVSIQVELDDSLALQLQDDVTREVVEKGATGVIIDVSAIEIMDSYIARVINDIGKNVAIMGARPVLVGLQPAIAITLIEMGMDMDSVDTALNLELGLEKLGNTIVTNSTAQGRVPRAEDEDEPDVEITLEGEE